jgi:hypothetical protein
MYTELVLQSMEHTLLYMQYFALGLLERIEEFVLVLK